MPSCEAVPARLNLVVLRVTNLEQAARFYTVLGLAFVKHRHGTGPEHYACEVPNGLVFELYPRKAGQSSAADTRIGFAVLDVREATNAMVAVGGTLLTAPADSPWGLRAVVADPDGHKVELKQHQQGSKP